MEFMKNGKKWETYTEKCDRCGGAGYSTTYSWAVNGCVCFKCHGVGTVTKERRILTEKEKEQRAKAKLKRDAKKQLEYDQRMAEKNAKFISTNFMGSDKVWVVDMKDTFHLREEFRELGGRWNQYMKVWTFSERLVDYDMFPVHVADVCQSNNAKEIDFVFDVEARIQGMMTNREPVSNHIGTVGERLKLDVKIIRCSSFETQYGRTYVYGMIDENGNQFTWFGSNPNLEEGKHYMMNATVKDHNEYQGQKQTIVTRCMKIKETTKW